MTTFDIQQTPSPNHDERRLPITLLILHYTGMETGLAARERLCDSAAKVSAHYVVEEDGQIYQLVDEARRGIEIVNGGHDFPDESGGLPAYPDIQINAVIALSKTVIERYNIRPLNVLGHSDIAPDRKIDPGEHFPWAGLSAAGIGCWPEGISDDRRVLFEAGSRDRGVAIIQRGLAQIGYSTRVSGVLDSATQLIISALQRRYRPDQIDGLVDIQTMEIIKYLTEISAQSLSAKV